MRFKQKLLILFIAVVLSFLGFYLISSPFAEFLALAEKLNTDTAKSLLAECNVEVFPRIMSFNFYGDLPGVIFTPAASG